MLKKTGIIIAWLLVWQLLAVWVDSPVLLATPLQTVGTLALLVGKVLFWKTIAGSVLRIVTGFLLGLGTGILLAVLAGRFRLAEEIFAPVITLMKAVPVASFVVLLLIWWGSSFLAVAICFLVVLPNIYLSTLEGIRNTDAKLLEMAAVFRISFKNRFFYIYRPALRPFLESSLKVALGMCWKSGVAAELIGTPAFSIGERLYMSKIYLDTAGVFAWTAVIILLSIGFEKLFLWLTKLFFEAKNMEPAWRRMREPERNGADAGCENCQTDSEAVQEIQRGNLVCTNLSKSYGDLPVIRDFSAAYEPGQIYYLRDPSGSGKTTLLRLLCGLERPDGGEVAPAMRFGFQFQEDRLCEDYSAIRNVELVMGSKSGMMRKGSGRPEGVRRKRAGTISAAECLRELLPEDSLEKPCSQLSGGMRRRVALVRAMEADSDCVLLDEPFTGMDPETREKAFSYILKRQNGRIVIIATHL